MSNTMPDVTVLLTVYNGMPYLKESVECILAQSLREFRFHILNNASTDGTRAYLESLTDPRLHIEHLPENIGRTAVLNKGLSGITTLYTAIIDADDLAHPTRLEKQYAFLMGHPGVDLLGSDVIYIDRAGNPLGKEQYPQDHATLLERLPLHNQFSHAACMFRTRSAIEAGGYSAAFPYAQDFGLWIAMLQKGSRVASLPEFLASIRVHAGQTTRDLKLIMVRNEDNHRLALAMLGIPQLSSAAQQAALLRSAGALIRLARHKEAARQVFRAICVAPWLLPVNPLLWRRLGVMLKRRLT